MVITDSLLLDFIAVISALVAILITYVKWKYGHWERLGLENPKPVFGFGNLWDTIVQNKTIGDDMEQIYFKLRAKRLKHAGLFFFNIPIYMPMDPEIIKHIMQVDFGHFVDRGVFFNEKDDPLSAHLFSLEGAKWRNLRAKLSPTFTSGKMKMMYPIVVKTSEELTGVLDAYDPDDPVEIKDILARLTTDIIGTCAFGLDCNSLRDPNTEFRINGKKVFDNTGKERLMQLLSFLFPGAMRLFGAKIISDGVTKFFMGVVRDTVKYREANDVKRNDFMQLLIQLKDKGAVSEEQVTSAASTKLTFNEVAAQAFVFFIAGFETSSTTMSYCLYELAVNEDIQEKVREEINTVLARHNGEFTYEAMMEMHYMEMALNETLRKYPPLSMISRICVNDYKVPDTNVTLPKGTRVFIPVQSLQHDPEYYPHPEVFAPLRFTEEDKHKRHPFTFLPFGEGPRICIGMRFGIMQAKVGLTVLLKNYRLKLNSQTQVPLRSDPKNLLNAAIGGIWMNITKIDSTSG